MIILLNIAFDLIYNPAETQFEESEEKGAQIKMDWTCLFFRRKRGKYGISRLIKYQTIRASKVGKCFFTLRIT
jgi:hypothetical protein